MSLHKIKADQIACDWAELSWAPYQGKEMVKNLLDWSDTETYEGVPAKHALILLLSALFLSSYTNCESSRGSKLPIPNLAKEGGQYKSFK